jgi:uncharacterized protein YbcI
VEEFFVGRIGRSGDMEIKFVDDLILLRCKEALSPSEINIAALRYGRLLLQAASERLCHELQPELNRLLRHITGRRLFDIYVGIFFKRREKIYVFTMSGRAKQ